MEKVEVKAEEVTKDPDSSTQELRKAYRKHRNLSSSSLSSSSRSRSREKHPSRRRHRSIKRSRRCRSKCSCSRCRSRSRSPKHSRRARYYGSRENPNKSTVLGVFGLSNSTNEARLLEVFSPYGGIEKVEILHDAYSGNSRGFGFICFTEIEAAESARKESNGMSLDGRRIRVDYSITKRGHTPTPGIYMGARDSNSSDRRRRSGYHRSDHRRRSSRSSRSSRRASRDYRRSRSNHSRSRRNHSRSRRHYSDHDSSRYSRSHSR